MPPLTQRGCNTRARLLRSARAIFGKTAFADVRIIDITARARVASGTFYAYFQSNEEILLEVATQVLEALRDIATPAPDAEPKGVVTFRLDARREPRDQVIHTPNWPMDGDHFMTVTFREWTQDIESWIECRLKRVCK